MRIIGGRWKGRVIRFPSKSWPVRPTTDFAREALFNILDNRLDYENSRALDLFGGTGIHSIELASRGCSDITYVDRHRESAKFLRTLAKEWDIPVNVIQQDAMAFVRTTGETWDYIFADPPYDMKNLIALPEIIREAKIVRTTGFFVLEHASKLSFEKEPAFLEARHYGQTVFSFFGAGS